MHCTNCDTSLSCGCQKRIARDGLTAVCVNCEAVFNAALFQPAAGTAPPVYLRATATLDRMPTFANPHPQR